MALNVRIYLSDVAHLEKGVIKLQSGEEILADAILCGTGWLSSLQFFSRDLTRKLGLPHDRDHEVPEDRNLWEHLETEADREVCTKFHQLANPPPHYHPRTDTTPCRLYRQIVPLSESSQKSSDRSIALVGYVDVGNYFPTAMCQAMWATAYMDCKLTLPSIAQQRETVALFRAWSRRRYLSRGEV